jgi:hypothetical protein
MRCLSKKPGGPSGFLAGLIAGKEWNALGSGLERGRPILFHQYWEKVHGQVVTLRIVPFPFPRQTLVLSC